MSRFEAPPLVATVAGLTPAARALLCISALLAVGPLWLSPEDISDGLFGSARVAMGDLTPVETLYREGNLHRFLYYYRCVGWLQSALGIPAWVVYKGFNTACVLWIGREIWCLTARQWRWPLAACVGAVSLLWVFPVWSMLHTSVQMVAVFVGLVFWGHRQMHEAAVWRQALGWLAVALSLHLNANFAFVLGLEALRWATRDRAVAWFWARSASLAALAVGLYALSRAVHTPAGEFVAYNALLDLRQPGQWAVLLVGLAKFATFGVFAAALWLLIAVQQRRAKALEGPATPAGGWWALGLAALAFTAVFPYAAVGKSTALFFAASPGTSSMFAQLRLGLGDWGLMSPWGIWSNRFALLLACVSALVCGWLLARSQLRGRRLAAALGAVWLFSATLALQAHGTKLDQLAQVPAIIAGLRSLPAPPAGMLDIEATPKQRFIFPEMHEPNWFAYRAWGERKWMAVLFYDDGASERIVRNLAERHYSIRAGNPLRAGIYLADEYPGPQCQTRIQLQLPPVDRLDMLMLAGHRNGAIPPAKASLLQVVCPPARTPLRAKNFSELG